MTQLQIHDLMETNKVESTALVNDEIQGNSSLLIVKHTCM